MKKILLMLLAMTPLALFAAEGVETDIVQRTVNFIIFAGILWYLLAEKIKVFFVSRSLGIQAELDKVQDSLKESQSKVDDAVLKLEEAKKLAIEIVSSANAEIDSIKSKVAQATENEIVHLKKNLDEKMKLETRKAKKVVVQDLLDELLDNNNIGVSQEELANIVIKKVA